MRPAAPYVRLTVRLTIRIWTQRHVELAYSKLRRRAFELCILAACLALCAHHNREGKHDKQAKPWEPSHSGPAPHSLDLVSTKEHGDDVPEAIRKLEANDNAV